MLPLLRLASDGEIHSLREAVEALSDELGLTKEERVELFPSGTAFVMSNRVGWARAYLKEAELLSNPKRGHFQITDRGKQVLASDPDDLNTKMLRSYDEYRESQQKSTATVEGERDSGTAPYSTPQEALEYGYQKLSENLADEVLEYVMDSTPKCFEKIVVDLLVQLGYGGILREAASVVGKSGDAGIDGIVREDRLELSAIYVQAKRLDGVVGRPEIQEFAGARPGDFCRLSTSWVSTA